MPETTVYITVEVNHDGLDADAIRDSVQASAEHGTINEAISTGLQYHSEIDGDKIVEVSTFVADGMPIEPLVAAAEDFASIPLHTWADVAPGLTCAEAETFAELLRAAGRPTAAHDFLEAHAQGDNEPTDSHHEMYQP